MICGHGGWRTIVYTLLFVVCLLAVSDFVPLWAMCVTVFAAFLICDCCGATREIEPKASAEIIAAGAAAGYALTAVTIEAHGLCADCRN